MSAKHYIARGGIYEIRNLVNGKRYIGSAVNLERRRAYHWWQLPRGRHHSRHLQAAWNRYGPAAFQFRVLLCCAPVDLLFYEQRSIDVMRPQYNVSLVAGSCLGVKRSEETRRLISVATTGRKLVLSKEERTRRSERARGLRRGLSPEAEERIAAAKRGKRLPAETVARMSAAASVALRGNKNTLGYRHTEEAKAKMSAAKTGVPAPWVTRALKGRPKTSEHRAKIAAAKVGSRLSPETRKKISASRIGITPSDLSRKKMSESQLARQARVKAETKED